jgi:alpha-glucosidase
MGERCLVAVLLLAGSCCAQDERRVRSPNGEIECRLFIGTQTNSSLSRIAYEVFFRGKPLIDTSFLGMDIQDQEPLLGENVGLTSSSSTASAKYNSLTAKYMQNGSLGRLIDVEARAYNDGVAFRYVIPQSTPLMDILIAEEATEFRFAEKLSEGSKFEGGPEADYNREFANGSPNPSTMLRAGALSAAISESSVRGYPRMRLVRSTPTTDLTRLDRKFEGKTPVTSPWRIISITSSWKTVLHTTIIQDLNR